MLPNPDRSFKVKELSTHPSANNGNENTGTRYFLVPRGTPQHRHSSNVLHYDYKAAFACSAGYCKPTKPTSPWFPRTWALRVYSRKGTSLIFMVDVERIGMVAVLPKRTEASKQQTNCSEEALRVSACRRRLNYAICQRNNVTFRARQSGLSFYYNTVLPTVERPRGAIRALD